MNIQRFKNQQKDILQQKNVVAGKNLPCAVTKQKMDINWMGIFGLNMRMMIIFFLGVQILSTSWAEVRFGSDFHVLQ